MKTVWHLMRTERVLQYRSIYGACVFAGFSAFWTTAAFLLSGPPYQYTAKIIGLFGLVAISGVIASPVAGRLADRGWARFQTAAFLLCTFASWLPIALGATHLVWLVFGIILMDFGVHGTQITNQSEIYRLNPGARSRLTTAYMTTYFIGGAMGSQTGAMMYERYGWNGVCWTGAGFVAAVHWSFCYRIHLVDRDRGSRFELRDSRVSNLEFRISNSTENRQSPVIDY